jgi:hypothetical protein
MTGPRIEPGRQPQRVSRHSGTARPRTPRSQLFAPASWLFVAVALVVIGVLTYYLTLTTRPEISKINPAPNTEQVPGAVQLSDLIMSSRDIDAAELTVDRNPVQPTLERQGDNRWLVSFEDVFDRALIEVVVLGSQEIVELAPLGEKFYEECLLEGLTGKGDASNVDTEVDVDDQDD